MEFGIDKFLASLDEEFGSSGKGKPFEKFCKWFLENDPAWSSQVDKVWLYFRHEAISRMFDEGMTVPQVASISGHRTVSMLFRYAHTTHNVRVQN